jgi:hypothetical protein
MRSGNPSIPPEPCARECYIRDPPPAVMVNLWRRYRAPVAELEGRSLTDRSGTARTARTPRRRGTRSGRRGSNFMISINAMHRQRDQLRFHNCCVTVCGHDPEKDDPNDPNVVCPGDSNVGGSWENSASTRALPW